MNRDEIVALIKQAVETAVPAIVSQVMGASNAAATGQKIKREKREVEDSDDSEDDEDDVEQGELDFSKISEEKRYELFQSKKGLKGLLSPDNYILRGTSPAEFSMWQRMVTSHLDSLGMMGILKGRVEDPQDEELEAVLVQKNMQLLGFLKTCLMKDKKVKNRIGMKTLDLISARKIWRKAEKVFLGSRDKITGELWEEYESISMTKGGNADEYLNSLMDVESRLEAAQQGSRIDDALKKKRLREGLSESIKKQFSALNCALELSLGKQRETVRRLYMHEEEEKKKQKQEKGEGEGREGFQDD